jgi:hypothetical protein
MNPLLLGTAAAFGLSASAGLNTTLPLLIVGLLARAGLIQISPPYDALASDVALVGLGALALLEIVADKVPVLDSGVQAIQWPLAAAAGAILFASQTSVVSWVSPGLAILVGLLTAGAVHGARTSVRPAVTLLTGGLGNVAISSMEDGTAVVMTLLAALSPMAGLVVVLVLVVVLIVLATWSVRYGLRLARGARALSSGAPRTPTP